MTNDRLAHRLIYVFTLFAFLITQPIMFFHLHSPLAYAKQDLPTAIPIVQMGHTGQINTLAISPDDRIVISGGEDGTLKFWDRSKEILINSIRAHSDRVNAISISPNGKYVVSGGGDKAVRLWDIATGQLVRSFDGHTASVSSVAFSSDGETIASGSGSYANVKEVSDNTIRIWETSTGRAVQVLRGHQSRIQSLSFNTKGDRVVSGSLDGSVKIWSIAEGKALLSIPTKSFYSVSYSPDNQTVASAGSKEIVFWSAQTGRAIRKISHGAYSTDIAFRPDWGFLVLNSSPIEIRDVNDGRIIRTVGKDSGNNLALSNDGLYLASGGYSGLSVLDINRGVVSFKYDRQPTFSTGLSFNREGDKVAWGMGQDVYVWDVNRGRLQFSLTTNADDSYFSRINEVAFSPDGRMLASCSDVEVKIWSMTDGRELRLINKPTNDDDPYEGYQSLTFSPDGKILAVAGNPGSFGIRFYDPNTGRLLKRIKVDVPKEEEDTALLRAHDSRTTNLPGGESPRIHSINFSPDGQFLASGDSFNRIFIWRVRTGEKIRELIGHRGNVNSVAFSPDGKRLVSGSFDSTAKVWDVASWKLLGTLEEHRDSVSNVKFSPDGQYIVTASYDHMVRLWDSRSLSLLATLEDHNAVVTSVALSPRDKVIASGSMDGKVNLWSIPSKILLSTIMVFDNKEWLYFSPDGYFEGSQGAERNLVWRVNDQIHTGASFAQRFSNVDLLVARYKGTAPPFTPSAKTYSPSLEAAKTPSASAEEQKFRTKHKDHRFYALVIGNQNYTSLSNIDTSLKDAEDIARVLETRYGFKVNLLRNATRQQIVDALSFYEATLDGNSSLLIYYSGHGTIVQETEFAYWQPVDAKEGSRSNWISSNDIVQSFKLMNAAHVLVVADSCFAGGLFKYDYPSRSGAEPIEELLKLMDEKSRTVIASGGLEPVDWKGEDGYSVFGKAFLDGLKKMPSGVFTADRLFYEYIKTVVPGQARQTPEIKPIYNSGDKNGRFIFVRR
jgi:WD40 repeat protein